jgi:hypothetical protein
MASRLVLAALTLFGAASLEAQATVRPAAVPAFPYGKYTIQPAPGGTPDPDALTVVFIDGAMQIYKHGEMTRADGMVVAGERWQVWQDEGPCATPQVIVGTYRWSVVGGVLSFTLVEDACAGRAEKVAAVKLIRTP